jgi:hypothetical protein
MLTIRVTGGADFTDQTVTPARRAKFSSIKNDLKVQVIPAVFAKHPFEVTLGFDDIAPTRKSPALSKSVNVRIYREAGYTEGLRHDNTGRFMANPRKSLECFKVPRYLTTVLLNQNFTQTANRF